MNKLQRFSCLTIEDKTSLVKVMMLLPALIALLRLVGVRRTQRILGSLSIPTNRKPGTSIDIPRHLARLTDIASRHGIIEANCLQRSLALWFLLRRRRIDCRLRLGARKQDGTFEAHAWVELDGIVINDNETVIDYFSPFDRAINYLSADH